MAARAQWKGFLRLSLVSCPIALFPATSAGGRVSFNQINSKTGNRVRMKRIDEGTQEDVDYADIVKGYAVAKNEYVTLDKDELEAVAIESTRTIDIDTFVPAEEIDPLYLADPYYLVPDGEVGAQAFAVIRDAILKEKMVALGRVVFSTREHMMAIQARDKGLFGTTLRYPYEVRAAGDYYEDIPDEKIPKDMLELATHIVKSKAGHFHPETFEDHYESALVELLRKKQAGVKITPAKANAPQKVINLMDALRRSVAGEAGRRASASPTRRAAPAATRAAGRRPSGRARKAG
jgi:DNA end-binding protein Ku